MSESDSEAPSEVEVEVVPVEEASPSACNEEASEDDREDSSGVSVALCGGLDVEYACLLACCGAPRCLYLQWRIRCTVSHSHSRRVDVDGAHLIGTGISKSGTVVIPV